MSTPSPGREWEDEKRGTVVDGGTELDGSEFITVEKLFDPDDGERLWFAKIENDAGDYAHVVGGFTTRREPYEIAAAWLEKARAAAEERRNEA